MKPAQDRKVLVINPADNVAVALEDLSSGDGIRLATCTLHLATDIRFGHKFAVQDIECGAYIVKYGARIGIATQAISQGEHVHIHNVSDIVDEVRRVGRAALREESA